MENGLRRQILELKDQVKELQQQIDQLQMEHRELTLRLEGTEDPNAVRQGIFSVFDRELAARPRPRLARRATRGSAWARTALTARR